MMRSLLLGLLLASAAGAQFVEIEVDASAREGELRPVFGIDAPKDARQAKLLLERGASTPVRLGPEAAMREELAEALTSAWLDDNPTRTSPAGPFVWVSPPRRRAPVEDAVDAVASAMGLLGAPPPAAYYKARRDAWFGDDREPLPLLPAFELAARLTEAPRLVRLTVDPEQNVKALGGVSPDGKTIQILLARTRASDDAPPQEPFYLVYVRNLPWAKEGFATERYRLDAGSHGGLVNKGRGRGGLARISARFEAPALELIVLRKSDDAATPGVIRRRARPQPTPHR
jgi:hypothetical protein